MPNRSSLSGIERYALITNIEHVQIAGVRTYTCALVVQRDRHPLTELPRHRLRGFGTSCRSPTFDCEIPHDEFDLADAHDPSVVVSRENGQVRPLRRGAILRIAGWAHEAHLVQEPSANAPIDVRRFPAGAEVGDVWRSLDRAILRHWSAPYFPATTTRAIKLVRFESSWSYSGGDDSPWPAGQEENER